MNHGHVQNETFAGYELHLPPSRALNQKIAVSSHKKYRFVGYKTSILRHLIDCGDEVVSGSAEGTSGSGVLAVHTVQVAVKDVMNTATEQYVGAIQGAALGAAGEAVQAVGTMNSILDGVSVLGMIEDALPSANKPELKRPGKWAYRKDHLMNGRIIVDIEMHTGARTGWTDTESQSITLLDVAYIVADS